MSPAVVGLLFHAPGVVLFSKRRLTPLAVKLNLVALGATVLAMVVAGLERGFPGVVVAWAVGHTVWSITFAVLIHRGLALQPSANP